MATEEEAELMLESFGSTYGGMLHPDGTFYPAVPDHSEVIRNFLDWNIRDEDSDFDGFLFNTNAYENGWHIKYDIAYLIGFVHVEWNSGWGDDDCHMRLDTPGAGYTPAQAKWVNEKKKDFKDFGGTVNELFFRRPYSGVYYSGDYNYLFYDENIDKRAEALARVLEIYCPNPVSYAVLA